MDSAYHDQSTSKNGTLLIVDDKPQALEAICAILQDEYEIQTFNQTADALLYLEHHQVDLILASANMAGINGLEFLSRCYDKDPFNMRFVVAEPAQMEKILAALKSGRISRYLLTPWTPEQLRYAVSEAIEFLELKKSKRELSQDLMQQSMEIDALRGQLVSADLNQIGPNAAGDFKRAYESLRSELDGTILLLLRILECRTDQEVGSNEKTAQLALRFAEAIGLPKNRLTDLYYAALLRNLGKIFLPDHLLAQPLPQLTPDEKAQYSRFPIHGQVALMMLEPFQRAANLIRHHMELFNGKGYPDKLSGAEIAVEARLLRIVSDYIDLQKPSNFLGDSLSEAQSRRYIQLLAGQRYDPELAEIFSSLLLNLDGRVITESEIIELEQAVPGMKIVDNVLSPAGVVVLTQGTTLTPHNLRKLATLKRQTGVNEMQLHVQQRSSDLN